jgi:hypothetical protein
MNAFNSMRRDFLRTGSLGANAAAIPVVSFAADARHNGEASLPEHGVFDVRIQ